MAINPLEFFNVGATIGGARSPVSGVGQMIRGILDQAYKRNLLNDQYSSALELAKYKQAHTPTTKNIYGYDKGTNALKDFGPVGIHDQVINQQSTPAGYVSTNPMLENSQEDSYDRDMEVLKNWYTNQVGSP